VPYIINGQISAITQFPWQVLIWNVGGEESFGFCGGAIVSSTKIVTAAHCVDVEGTTRTLPAEDLGVIAGASEVLIETGEVAPATAQQAEVATVHVDPRYVPEQGNVQDDLAVLTLKTPLDLSRSVGAAAIGLVAARATPAPGTLLTVSGYGRQKGAETPDNQPNGKLYSATLTAISSDECRESVGANSAVLLCASSGTSATCEGDSGGPLVEGTPAVLVGLVDFGLSGCPVDRPYVFTNLAAPEIRAFVEGALSPPVAPRLGSPPTLKSVGPEPVAFSPLTCEPGTWSESPNFSYTFQLENGTRRKVLQNGAKKVYIPTSADIGAPITCLVEASNAGGVGTARSKTTPAVAADTSPPTSRFIAPPACHANTCKLEISASDPNGAAITLNAAASYHVRCSLSAGLKPARGGGRKACNGTTTVPMTVSSPGGAGYQATVSSLPYGVRIDFSVLATNAAGLKDTRSFTSITLPKPPKGNAGRHRPRRSSKRLSAARARR
jgi:hypothetical protein